ncbi:g8215 [Coccomyxa viridis]|uniref:G8215 protein n=1 Tax=Coccomyxa viridis TaxID=1274662 RepID=A0ABP1G2B7_9CHLO
MLNQAFCHLHHYKFCPHTEELITQCGMADQIMAELEVRWEEVKRAYGGDLQCVDAMAGCNCNDAEEAWFCRKSCGLCRPANT